jgi:hypothetical protein
MSCLCTFNFIPNIWECPCNSYILNGNSSNFERLLITLHINMEVSSDIFLRVFRIFHQKGCTNKSSIFHMGITISFSKEKMATSFSGGRSRSTQREPPTMGKYHLRLRAECTFFCNIQSRAFLSKITFN